jgi:hypothetical protein
MKLLLSAALGAAAGIYLWTWANSEPSVMPIFIDGGAPEISAQSVCEGKTEGACGIPGRGVEDFVNKLVPTIRGHANCNGTPVFVIWSNKENWYSTMSEDKKKAYNNTHFDLMVDFYPEQEKHSWMMSRSDKPILKSTVIPWSEGTIQDIANAVCQMAYEQRH